MTTRTTVEAAAPPETQGEREWHRLTLTSVGLLGGTLTAGLVDAALYPGSFGSVWAVSTTAMVWLGILTAPLVVLGAQPLLPLIYQVAVRGYSWWRIIVGVGLLLGVVLGVASAWYIWWRGIILSAIDYRPAVVFVSGALVGLAIYFLLLGRPWLTRLALPATLCCAFGVTIAALVDVDRTGAVVERLADDGALSRYVAVGVRAGLDRDGDGYPSAMCEAVCDCNDGDPAISPASTEVPNNGWDDDCYEGDLKWERQPVVSAAPDEARDPDPEGSPELAEELAGPWVDRPNILLITVDTLRSDHLGCYGYERETSPNLDALSARSVRFDQARSQGPMTRYSVPSLITGRFFSELRRTSGQWPQLQPQTVTMAELLKVEGYHTFSFHSIGYFVPLYGFSQGFDYYDVSVVRERDPVHWNRTSDLLTERVLDYFDERVSQLPAGQPWFLWAYFGDPHSGYTVHDDLPKWGKEIPDIYDQEILFTDKHIGRLLDGLEARHELSTTVVIVTADHGEGLVPEQDHGHQYHGQHLYDNLLKVPLIVYAPGVKPGVVERPVANLDVLPTILELVGAKRPERIKLHGVSLVPSLFGHDVNRGPVFSEKVSVNQYPQKSMVQWPYKIIWKIGPNQFRLYNLEKDPNELNDLKEERPIVLQQMKRRIQVWRATVLDEIPPIDANPR